MIISVVLAFLFLAGSAFGQFGFGSGKDTRWRTVGAGPSASRPATCTAERDVYICVGAGCTNGQNIHYCRATDTWEAQGTAAGSGITSLGGQTGATQTITRGAGIGGSSAANDHAFTTASGETDFLSSGALTCGASTQGRMLVHTTALQYCDNAATPVLRYAAYGTSAGLVDLATTVTGILPGANGGTGNGFFAVSGPATSLKTFTFPDASATVLTTNAAVTVAQGGTGIASGTSGGVPYFSSTTTIASSAALTANAIVKGGGAGAAPVASGVSIDGSNVVTGVTAIAFGADPADAGPIRLSNNTSICWEIAIPGTDKCLKLSASDEFELDGPLNILGTAGPLRLTEIAAPGAPGSLNQHNVYFDSADNLLKSHENAGSVVTYVTLTATQTLTNKTLTSPTLTSPALGTPASGVLTNATGLPISTGVSGLGTGVATFLGTPSSANLAAALTDETGDGGGFVRGTNATLTTPTISGAIAFPDDVRQTFNPGATVAGLNVGSQAGDPSTPINGDLWYDSTGNLLRARINGASVSLGSGSGTVTSVDAIEGVQTVSGSAITTTGSIRGTLIAKAEVGTTYTFLTGDRGKAITFSNAGAITATLPDAGGSFPDGWYVIAKNIGAGDLTINRTTSSTISGATSIVLSTGEFAILRSDGTHYEAMSNRITQGTGISLSNSRTAIDIAINSATVMTLSGTQTVTGDKTFTGVVTIPQAAAPTVDAVGEIAMDTNHWGTGRGAFLGYDGTAGVALVGILTSDTCANGEVAKFNTGGTWTCEVDATGGTAAWDTLTAPTGAVSLVSNGIAETFTVDMQAAFTTGSQIVFKSSTGNPTGGVLFEVLGHDADVTPFKATGDGTNGIQLSAAGSLTAIGTGGIVATTGDSATSFFSTGTLENARLDSDLAALGDNSTNGLWARTGAGTGAARTITAGAGLAGSNLDGVSGNPTLTTASSEADFLASGALTCGASTQGKMQIHTTPLQYCDNAATPALQYAAYANSIGSANELAGMTANGIAARTGAATWTNRTITGTTNQITVTNGDGVSGNPTIDVGTNVLLAASTHTLTNKTIDVEATGNVFTATSKIWLAAASCQGTTGSLLWDTIATGQPTATCSAGTTETNLIRGVADFLDTGTAQMQLPIQLPSDWTGAVDIALKWRTAVTINDVVWQVSTVCRADAEVDDAAFNAANTVTDTAKGTANQLNDASITGITTTGCAAGELMHLRILRDPAHASDSLAATASLVGVEVTLRRAM